MDKKKKRIIIACLCAIALSLGCYGLTIINNPKFIFAMRMKQNISATHGSLEYTVNFDSKTKTGYDSILKNAKVHGQYNVDGNRKEVTLAVDGLKSYGVDFGESSFLSDGENTYLDTQSLSRYKFKTNGVKIYANDGEYLNLADVGKVMSTSSKDVKNDKSSKTLDKSISSKVITYIEELDDKHFKKSQKDVSLVLNKKEAVELQEIILKEILKNSGYASQDSYQKALVSYKNIFDKQFKTKDAKLEVSLGKKIGNNKITLSLISNEDKKINIVFVSKAIKDKAPKEPKLIISENEFKKRIQAAYFESTYGD